MAVATRARWEGYAEATRGPDFAWWAEQHCIQAVDRFAGQPLVLEDWQRDFMDEALAEEADGVAYWRTIVLILPKKNGKTALLSAYALYEVLENAGAPEVLLAAATDKQAGRLFTAARRFVKSDPWLDARLVVRDHEGQIAQVGTFGTIHRFSGESGASAGTEPSLVVADELAEWNTPRRERTWADIATAGELTREAARVFVISHAGEPQERKTGILGKLLDANETNGEIERVHRALTISRDHESRTLVYNYCAATYNRKNIPAIRAANPASWISTEGLAALSKSAKLTDGQFLQLHGCVWASSIGALLTIEEWRALEAPDAKLKGRDALTIGFRGGDGWALVACRRRDSTLFPLGVGESPDIEQVDAIVQSTLSTFTVAGIFAAPSAEWKTTVDKWRKTLGRKRVIDVHVELPGPRTAQIVDRFQADAGHVDQQAEEAEEEEDESEATEPRVIEMKQNCDEKLAAAIAGARVAVAKTHKYLTADIQHPVSIAPAHAAMLAWEANAILPLASDALRNRRNYRIEQV